MSIDSDKKKILLVEDNPADARLIKEYFKEIENSSNFIIEHLDRFEQVNNKVTNENFDLVLLDLYLPDSDGVDTFVKLHSKFKELPIVVLTGLDDTKLAEKVVGIGAQDYLVKSDLQISRLKSILNNAFSREVFKKSTTGFDPNKVYKSYFPYPDSSNIKTQIATFSLDSNIKDLDSIFQFFIEIYQNNVKNNVPGLENKIKLELAKSLSSEAEAFAILDLSPLDLITIHNAALNNLIENSTEGKSQDKYIKISKVVLFELMNITLKDYYNRQKN